jgi:hypothetical protein
MGAFKGGKMHKEEFDNVIDDCRAKYDSKASAYGESWKTMDLITLNNRLRGEYEEEINARTTKKKYEELLDVINISLMLAERLRINAAKGRGIWKTRSDVTGMVNNAFLEHFVAKTKEDNPKGNGMEYEFYNVNNYNIKIQLTKVSSKVDKSKSFTVTHSKANFLSKEDVSKATPINHNNKKQIEVKP